MELKELNEQRGAIVRSLNDMSDRVANESRAFTPDELAQFDKLNEQQSKLLSEINTLERVERAKALSNVKTETVNRDNGHATGRDYDNAFRAWALRQSGNVVPDHLKRSADRCGADIYGDSFIVRQQSLSNSEGGYTKDSLIFQGLIESKLAYGGMAPYCTELNTPTGESIAWATNNDTGNVGSWGSELTAISNTSLSFGQATLSAYLNVSGVFPCSLQLAQDSHAPIENLIGRKLGERLARNLASAIVVGDGSAKPTGVKVTAATGKTATDDVNFTVDELIDLYVSVNSAYRSGARWLMNSNTLGTLMKMKDDNDRPLLMPDYNSQGGGIGFLFGKPVVVDDAVQDAAASAKPIFFGDFSNYFLRRAGGVQIAMDRSLYFKEMGLAFIAYERVDGKLLDAASVKALVMAAS